MYYLNELIAYTNLFNFITHISGDSEKTKKPSKNMFHTTLKQNW